MAGRGTDEGRRKLPGSGRGNPSRPRPEVTAPGTEIAAMERRGARASHQTRPRFAKRGLNWMRRAALRPLAFFEGERGEYGVPGAAQTIRARRRALLEYGRRSLR